MKNLRKTIGFCFLGPSGGSSWTPLKPSWGAFSALFRPSWAVRDHPGPSWSHLGPLWKHVGPCWRPGWPSWAVLEPLDSAREAQWLPRDPQKEGRFTRVDAASGGGSLRRLQKPYQDTTWHSSTPQRAKGTVADKWAKTHRRDSPHRTSRLGTVFPRLFPAGCPRRPRKGAPAGGAGPPKTELLRAVAAWQNHLRSIMPSPPSVA